MPLWGRAGSPFNTMWPGPRPTFVQSKWHLDPSSRLAIIDMGRKLRGLCPFLGEGELPQLCPHLTQRRLGGAYLPGGILIHPAVWPQQTWAGPKIGGYAPLVRGSWVPIWHNATRAEAYLRAKFQLDPSNRLATIHLRYRQTDSQRSDSIGRTVLQTVSRSPNNQTQPQTWTDATHRLMVEPGPFLD